MQTNGRGRGFTSLSVCTNPVNSDHSGAALPNTFSITFLEILGFPEPRLCLVGDQQEKENAMEPA